MTRDYASRSASRPAKRRGTGRKPAKRRGPARPSGTRTRNIWSTPSFSAGAIFGGALVLLLSHAPSVFEDTVTAARGPVTEPEAIEFDFPELLENGTVEVEPNAYDARFPGENPDEPLPEYQIQAISVKTADDATRITRELIALGLPARSERVELSSGPWYRIMVGPYNSRREAEHVINRLEERNMLPEIRTRG